MATAIGDTVHNAVGQADESPVSIAGATFSNVNWAIISGEYEPDTTTWSEEFLYISSGWTAANDTVEIEMELLGNPTWLRNGCGFIDPATGNGYICKVSGDGNGACDVVIWGMTGGTPDFEVGTGLPAYAHTSGDRYKLRWTRSTGALAVLINDVSQITGTNTTYNGTGRVPSLYATKDSATVVGIASFAYTEDTAPTRSVDSIDTFQRGATGSVISCTGLDAAPTTQTVTVTDGTHSDTCTINSWSATSINIDVDCALPPGTYSIQVTDDTGTVTLAGQTLLIEANYDHLTYDGTATPAGEESLVNQTLAEHGFTPVIDDQYGVEQRTPVTWDDTTQAVVSPAQTVVDIPYWAWDASAGAMFTGTITIAEQATLTSQVLTSTGQNTMQVQVDTLVTTGTIHAYFCLPTDPTPTPTDLEAGTGAVYKTSQPVTTAGTKTLNGTGFTAGTTYRCHLLQNNNGVRSDIVTTSDVATDSAGADTTPDAIVWTDVTGAEISSSHSDIQQITGVDAGETLTGVNCEVSNDNQSTWHASVTMVTGQTFARATSSASASYSTAVDLVATVNGVGDTFTITTRAADITPNAFSFTDVVDVAQSSEQISNAITVLGVDAGQNVPLTVTNGEYRVNAGAWSSAATNVQLGDQIELRHTSSASYSTSVDTTLALNTVVTDTFTSTTLAAPANQAPVITPQTFYVAMADTPNLIANGAFDADLSGWVNNNSHWSVVTNRAYHPSSSVYNGLMHTVSNDQAYVYRLSFDYETSSGGVYAGWFSNTSTGFIRSISGSLSGSGSVAEYDFIPASAVAIGIARQSGTTFDGYIDNVSISQVCPVVIGTVAVSDPDLDTLTYSITAGNTDNDIAIDSNTGVLSWANAPDPNRTSTYNITVQASDGELTASAAVTINVVTQSVSTSGDGFIRDLIQPLIQPLIKDLVN